MFDYKIALSALFALALYASACKKDPEPPNEEEIITTVNYTLTNTSDNSVVTLTFKDLDGDGGNAPIITGGTLKANATYSGNIELLNEQETPAEDITEEIRAEDEDHQFFYKSSLSTLNVAYADTDNNGNPVGLKTTLSTGAAGNGTLTITLLHEPNKTASGVASGDITNAEGEADIEVTFNVVVE